MSVLDKKGKVIIDKQFTPEQLERLPIERWKLQRIVNVLAFYSWSNTQFEIAPQAYINNKSEEVAQDMGRKAGETIELIMEHLKMLDEGASREPNKVEK